MEGQGVGGRDARERKWPATRMSWCRRPHLEDPTGRLAADWTQADVHFKGLWFQRATAGYVLGLHQSLLETDTLGQE